jgi:hypothetical protein
MKQLDELNPMPRWAMITIGGMIVVMGAFGFLYVQYHRPAVIVPPVQTPSVAATAKTVSTESGSVGSYKFTLMRKDSESVVALFQPVMLPRNDAIMIVATQTVIKQAFGDEVSNRPEADGQELRYQSKSHEYGVIIIKEDTGEIHTLVIRQK